MKKVAPDDRILCASGQTIMTILVRRVSYKGHEELDET